MALFLEKRVSPKATSLVSILALLFFLPFLLLVSYESVRLILRATGTKAQIVVNTKTILEPIKTDFYHAFAQGGEEATNMLASVVSETRALKPKLIRIDHIYDLYDVVGRAGGDGLTFNWARLDEVVDTIVSTGAKPLLSLSFMPAAIASGGNITNPPHNWDEWAQVVQRTIEHYSGRSGKNLSGVFYEVWNEPDLPQFGGWKLSGEKNYLTLYRFAAAGASAAQGVNQFFLGGPGTSGLYKNWILALVESGYRLNFLSWHSYLMSPAQFRRDQENITSWLLPYPNYILLPKLITEFGFTGAKDRRYGTNFAAAHTAAVIRQLISGGPQYLVNFEVKDGPNQADGNGWGLITHDDNGKKTKPRYGVFNFIDVMVGQRLEMTGEGTWVTGLASQSDKTIRILLVNFDSEGNHTENVPVTLTELDPGTYAWRERFFLGRDVKVTVEVGKTSLTREVYLPAQSIAILELTKQ